MQVQKAIANLSADDYETLLIHTEMDTGIVVAEQPLAFVKAIPVCVLCPVCVCVCVCVCARARAYSPLAPALSRARALSAHDQISRLCVCVHVLTHTQKADQFETMAKTMTEKMEGLDIATARRLLEFRGVGALRWCVRAGALSTCTTFMFAATVKHVHL